MHDKIRNLERKGYTVIRNPTGNRINQPWTFTVYAGAKLIGDLDTINTRKLPNIRKGI